MRHIELSASVSTLRVWGGGFMHYHYPNVMTASGTENLGWWRREGIEEEESSLLFPLS